MKLTGKRLVIGAVILGTFGALAYRWGESSKEELIFGVVVVGSSVYLLLL